MLYVTHKGLNRLNKTPIEIQGLVKFKFQKQNVCMKLFPYLSNIIHNYKTLKLPFQLNIEHFSHAISIVGIISMVSTDRQSDFANSNYQKLVTNNHIIRPSTFTDQPIIR